MTSRLEWLTRRLADLTVTVTDINDPTLTTTLIRRVLFYEEYLHKP